MSVVYTLQSDWELLIIVLLGLLIVGEELYRRWKKKMKDGH